MLVTKVGNQIEPVQVAGPTASSTEKRTTRIANAIISQHKLTDSSPITKYVVVGLVVGSAFLGVGALVGALVGLIHGIVVKKRFHDLKARVAHSIADISSLSAKDAMALLFDIDKFHNEYKKLTIYHNDDEMDMNVNALKLSFFKGTASAPYFKKSASFKFLKF